MERTAACVNRPQACFISAARWRRTYWRMPPCAMYSTSCGVVDRELLGVGGFREVLGEAALDARQHQVLEPDVGERAAYHDLVVAAARAILVVVGGRHAVGIEVAAGGAALGDVAGGRDVV